MKKINRKGFTLVELLAVIVILSVLVLVAMPAVTRLMTTARVNSFKTEVMGMNNYIETAFADKSLTGTQAVTSTTITPTTPTKVFTYNGNSYLCMTVSQLQSEGYMKKDVTGYSGIIQILVNSSGTSTTKVSVSNGTYTVSGLSTAINSSEYNPASGNSATAACPTTFPTTLS